MATSGEFTGIPIRDVVFNSSDSFKRFMNSNLDKLVPIMIEKSVFKRKEDGNWVLKQANPAENLIAILKTLSLKKFTRYLEVLIQFGSSEPADTEGGTRSFMRIMAGSLEKMKPQPRSKLEQTITRFISTARKSQTLERLSKQEVSEEQARLESPQTAATGETSSTLTTTTDYDSPTVTTDEPLIETSDSTQELSLDGARSVQSQAQISVAAATTTKLKPPPPGQIGDAVGGYFTSDGRMLYSPIHGVSVSIPPNAVPAHTTCYLGMHFYLGGPFVLADGAVSCSVVVWFNQIPYFELLEDVTVKIPHAAKIDVSNGGDDNSLCVLTWGEDKQGLNYKLSKEVSADFSDGYHAVFKVRHFCPKVVAKKSSNSKSKNASKTVPRRSGSQSKNRKRAGSNISKGVGRMNSDSLEKSLDEECTTLVTPPVSRSGSHDGNGSTESCISGSLTRQDAMDIDLPSTRCQTEERDESGSKISYSIACIMPADRSGTKWEVTFAACCNHPTGNWVRGFKCLFFEVH